MTLRVPLAAAFLGALLFSLPAAAQMPHAHAARLCGTETPTVQEVLASVQVAEQWLARNPTLANRGGGSFVTIPVAMHIITEGDTPALGNIPDAWITAQMDVLNEAYADMGLRFVVAFQQRVNNPAWRGITNGSAGDAAMKQALALNPARYINFYTSRLGNNLLGWATFPAAGQENNRQHGVVVGDQTLPGGNQAPYNQGDTGTHEVGHYVGLFHTFQGGCAADPNGGDGVADTPAEATPAYGCPVGRDTCPALPGLDPITNFMDYTDDACMIEFSPGQGARATALMNSFRPQMMNGRGAFVGTPPVVFPETYTGQTRTRVVRLVNLANGPITVTGATSSSAAFSVEGATGAVIPEAGALDLVLSFAPTAAGAASGTITFSTNDPDTPTVTLAVSGAGVLPAAAGLAPQAFIAEAAAGGTATRTLTLSNAGPAALAYSVNAVTRTSAPVGPLVETERDGGGPDAFGYRWNDSREAGGPVYDWVDISTTGTLLTLPSTNSAAAVTLPFSFPFYGTARTTTQVSSNGLLVFTGTATSPFQAPIPTVAAPNDYIAPFWRNLNPTLGGEVRTQDMGDGRFVVSWIDVPPATGTGTYTFQAILYANGRIRFQYQSMTGPLNAGGIGIENATGTVGLQVAYNNPDFLVDGLAVDVFTLPTWLSVAPSAGTVPVGQTQDVTLSMNASALTAGSYQALVDVTTNDPMLPQPTRLHAVFSVGGVLAPPALSSPRYGASAEPTSATLSWVAPPGATGYEWQVSATSDFATVLEAGTSAGTGATPSLATGTTYWWRVRSTDGVLPSAWSVPFTFTTAGIVSDEPGAPVVRSALGQPFPNPTQGAVTVPFALAEAEASVSVRVVDVTGRTVATLADGRAFGAGEHRLSVDASRLAPGVYVVQLRTSTGTESARLTVLR